MPAPSFRARAPDCNEFAERLTPSSEPDSLPQDGYSATGLLLYEILLFSFLLASAGAGHAEGFRIAGGLSIAGLGTADTLVANPVEPGALAYNPVAMSFHEERGLVSELSAVWYQRQARR